MNILKPGIFSLLIIMVSVLSNAQETIRIKIVNADFLRYDRSLGTDIKRLLNNVILEHDGALMYCDSAYLNEKTNSFDAFSKIRIRSGDTLNLYGDRLFYNGNTRIAEVIGNVRLIDRTTVLTTPTLLYDRNSGIAYYENNGVITDDENKLTSRTGYYMTTQKRIHFRKDVILTNPEYVMNSDTLVYHTITKVAYFHGPTTIKAEESFIYCQNGWYDTQNDRAQFERDAYIISGEHNLKGDSLFYDRRNEVGIAFENVFITDTVQNIILNGDYAEYYKNLGYTFITDTPMAVFAEENDSLFLHADTIRAYFDSEQNIEQVRAYFKVKYFRSDLQGMCDSLIYKVSDSLIVMYGGPVIWTDENQLTADSIYLKTDGEALQWMSLHTSAFIINRDDTANFNQVKGRNMTGYFENNKLSKIEVRGNAETIYYVREDNGALIGINRMMASNMRIELIDNKIRKIYYFEKPAGNISPQPEVPAEQRFLGNFDWKDRSRPKEKSDIFLRD